MNNLLETLRNVRFARKYPLEVSVATAGPTAATLPSPYAGALVISVDFEMAWAWRYAKLSGDPLEAAHYFSQATRRNVPRILEICDRYDVPMTWATVGHLFLNGCERVDGIAHSEMPRVEHHENDWWRFESEDWYDHDPCSSLEHGDDWYAPDLIDVITSARAGHEIGCHTFSHIDCSPSTCSFEVFQAEVLRCIELAEERGIRLRSFVFPGHFEGHISRLPELGFDACRIDRRNALSLPAKNEHGLWELVSTGELTYREEWSVARHIWYYSALIQRAIETGTVCHLYIHPSCRAELVEKVMPGLFANVKRLAESGSLLVTTMGGLVDAIA